MVAELGFLSDIEIRYFHIDLLGTLLRNQLRVKYDYF